MSKKSGHILYSKLLYKMIDRQYEHGFSNGFPFFRALYIAYLKINLLQKCIFQHKFWLTFFYPVFYSEAETLFWRIFTYILADFSFVNHRAIETANVCHDGWKLERKEIFNFGRIIITPQSELLKANPSLTD